jgi:hypothetical protein
MTKQKGASEQETKQRHEIAGSELTDRSDFELELNWTVQDIEEAGC